MLQVNQLHKSFQAGRWSKIGLQPSRWFQSRDRQPALQDVSFRLTAGDSLGIIGESGSGKSTLARILCGLDQPDSGTITLNGQPLPTNRRDRHRLVQLVFQDSRAAMNPRKTIRQILAVPLTQLRNLPAPEQLPRMTQLLSQVGLPTDFLDRRPHQLSGGQAQRIGLARALAAQPELLILDEPTSALDVSVQAQILALLRSLQVQHQFTLILISHDLAVVERLCTQGLVLKSGQVVETGAIATLYRQPRSSYTRSLIETVIQQSRVLPPSHQARL